MITKPGRKPRWSTSAAGEGLTTLCLPTGSRNSNVLDGLVKPVIWCFLSHLTRRHRRSLSPQQQVLRDSDLMLLHGDEGEVEQTLQTGFPPRW